MNSLFKPVGHDTLEDLWTPRYHPPFPREEYGFRNIPNSLWKQLHDAYTEYERASDAVD